MTAAASVTPAAMPAAEFTWQQVAAHNTPESAWVIIAGIVYDVTAWVDRHPGGRELVLLHAGRECTDTFRSYHPFSPRAELVLRKYAIGKLVGPTEFPQYPPPKSDFYAQCAKRVGAYFRERGIDPRSASGALWRMPLVVVLIIIAYLGMNGLLAWSRSTIAMYAWAVVYGVAQTMPLMHVMHDCSHAALSTSSTVWTLIGRATMDYFAGASMVSWLNQHIVGHHIYTNIAGTDPDLPLDFQYDVRRVVARQVLRPLYRFQHFYLPPLYGVILLKFRFQDVLETFYRQRNGVIRVNPHPWYSYVQLVVSKLVWSAYRLLVPLYVLQIPSKQVWGVFLLAEFVSGWYLAFNFQVSHVSTECEYPCGDAPTSTSSKASAPTDIPDEWAISQVKTSVDYAHGSKVVTFLSGALNYQIAHHLFPGISQYHYPAITPIIMDVCKEHGVKYKVLPSFRAAFWAHLRHLRRMGAAGTPGHLHLS